MRKTVKRAVTLVTVLLLVFLAACAPAPTPPPTPEPEPTADWGIIEIRVTDPPPADVEHVFVTLTNIEVHRVSDNVSGWETIIIDEVTFDLMDVIGVTAVLGSANVTAGSFTQIRLDVAEVDVVFVTDNITDNVTARVPSEKLKIVRPFNVGGGMTTVLTLDFDGKKSLIMTGQGKFLFKPVVKLLIEGKEVEAEGVEVEDEEEKEGELEFEGTIEAIAGDNWTMTIDNEEWAVDVSEADIEGEPAVGLEAEVKGTVVNGTIVASEVEIKKEEE